MNIPSSNCTIIRGEDGHQLCRSRNMRSEFTEGEFWPAGWGVIGIRAKFYGELGRRKGIIWLK